MSIQELTKSSEIQQFLNKYDSYLIDCDGVLWAAGHELPNASKTIQYLQSLNKKLIFVTNNSTKSRDEYQPKFSKIGCEIPLESIISSSYAVSQFLTQKFPDKTFCKIFVIGSLGLKKEMETHGFHVIYGNEIPSIASEEDFLHLKVDPLIKAVVIGCDFDFNYSKMAYASLCLQKNKTCEFIATSQDSFDQLIDRKIPGMTAAIKGIEASTGKKAEIIGKPSLWLSQYLITTYKLNPKRTCMIGDRLDSDILFGNKANLATLLVLTGCTKEDTLKTDLKENSSIMPTYLLSHIGKIYEIQQ